VGGSVATDVNNDAGWIFLLPRHRREFSLRQQANGKFDELGLDAGVAYSQSGRERSGMGVDSADFDQDGWQDLFVTNVDQEMYSIYRNNHDLTFEDMAGPMGLRALDAPDERLGVKFFDYDNDGNLDLFIANGHSRRQESKHIPATLPTRNRLLLFHNNGRTLENVSDLAGPIFRQSFAARGMAVGDFNNDGALDVLVSVNGGSLVLLKNVQRRKITGSAYAWSARNRTRTPSGQESSGRQTI